MRTMEPAMVLEVPNKSSNILNTFGLSKSHRSGNPSPRASPRLPAGASSLLPWLLPSRTRARVLRLLQPQLYTTAALLSRTKGSKEGW